MFSGIQTVFLTLSIISGISLFVMSISYPSGNKNPQKMSERFKLYPFLGMLFTISVAGFMLLKIFEGPNERRNFREKIKINPAVSIRINGLFFLDKDLIQQINSQKDIDIDEPREIAKNDGYFDGVIYFKNNDSASYKVYKSNSELKTYYFVDLKEDLALTKIKTSKFDSIIIDSLQLQ